MPVMAHLLVITNETAAGDTLHATVRDLALSMDADVLVVAPALDGSVREWLSDEGGGRRAATARVGACVDRLRAAGVRADARVGAADPLEAIADALQTFPADEVVIATLPPGRSRWLAGEVVLRAAVHFGLPIAHVVVDAVERTAVPGRGALAA